jgi:tRNA-specific 2-thiouridylase
MTDAKEMRDDAAGRIVVAMSGGVDSSVTAALLAERGHDVVGITLQLYDHGAAVQRKNACCAGQDIDDARRVADRIGIPHYVLDYESRFREQVIDDFVDSYVAGETPIPCVRCNQTVKFRDPDIGRERAGDRALRPPCRWCGRGRAPPRRRHRPRSELFPVRDNP